MRIKEVKEYSKRQRININKEDGLSDGQEVAILTIEEYKDLKQTENLLSRQIHSLKEDIDKLTIENKLLNTQQTNLKDIVADVITPINEQHQRELSAKDVEIGRLKAEVKALENKSHQLCIDIMDLSALQLIFTDKRKVMIDDFNKSISIVMPTDPINDAESVILKK